MLQFPSGGHLTSQAAAIWVGMGAGGGGGHGKLGYFRYISCRRIEWVGVTVLCGLGGGEYSHRGRAPKVAVSF